MLPTYVRVIAGHRGSYSPTGTIESNTYFEHCFFQDFCRLQQLLVWIKLYGWLYSILIMLTLLDVLELNTKKSKLVICSTKTHIDTKTTSKGRRPHENSFSFSLGWSRYAILETYEPAFHITQESHCLKYSSVTNFLSIRFGIIS